MSEPLEKDVVSKVAQDDDIVEGRWFYLEIITNPLNPLNKLEEIPKVDADGFRKPAFFKSFTKFVNAFDLVIKEKIPEYQPGCKVVAVKDPTDDVMAAYRIEEGGSWTSLVRGVVVDKRDHTIH